MDNKPKFKMGQLVATQGAIDVLTKNNQSHNEFIDLHLAGNWGNVPPEDWAQNDESVKTGGMLLSSYLCKDKTVLWVITEADRSVTTLLLPEEY